MSIEAEIKQVLQDLQHAWDNFSQATPEFVDAAIAGINYAQARLDALLRQARGERVA